MPDITKRDVRHFCFGKAKRTKTLREVRKEANVIVDTPADYMIQSYSIYHGVVCAEYEIIQDMMYAYKFL